MFFDMLFEIINAPTPGQKHQLIKAFLDNYKEILKDPNKTNKIFKDPHAKIYKLSQPSYRKFCTITHPTKIRRPKNIKSEVALAKVLHSIIHIEYSAIDLAFDAMYRFRNLPLNYYCDWLEVALEEEYHFTLLYQCLKDLGYEYGDFPVHTQLFSAQVATSTLHERMALLHRGLEANGLDANPFVVSKIKQFEHTLQPKLLQILSVILRDEIAHVKKGDKWWRFSHTNPTEQNFINTIKHFQAFYNPPKMLNVKARLSAGFSKRELDMLQALTKNANEFI